VKCTHGAAVGQLDEQAIFYLRARGIGEREAKGMLVHAFAGEVLDGVRLEPLRQRIEGVIAADLSAMLAGQGTV
jgi:Fe-S cluster assembly protein SufD